MNDDGTTRETHHDGVGLPRVLLVPVRARAMRRDRGSAADEIVRVQLRERLLHGHARATVGNLASPSKKLRAAVQHDDADDDHERDEARCAAAT